MECINGYRKYMDIMKGEKLRFPCQFVNPLQGGGDKVRREGRGSLFWPYTSFTLLENMKMVLEESLFIQRLIEKSNLQITCKKIQ